MNDHDIEELIERTAQRTASKVRDEMRLLLSMLGFNMDPDSIHEEQQVIAFARTMQQGTKFGFRAIIGAMLTAAVGWAVWFFTGHKF